MKMREAAVAGTFYDADPDRLRQHLASLMAGAPPYKGPAPAALIAPHAGYVYSGPVAARAYAALAPVADRISRVVLFGPAHRVALEGMAVPEVDAFATPLGVVPLDQEGLAVRQSAAGVCVSNEACTGWSTAWKCNCLFAGSAGPLHPGARRGGTLRRPTGGRCGGRPLGWAGNPARVQ
ncbi:MAG: AmmeMemoRadiSam system protein B [Halioglobus sp.]